MTIQFVLWLGTMLFFVAFFTYGYVLWRRSRTRRDHDTAAKP